MTEEGYVGGDVHRAARICSAGHGGQVLVSSSTFELVAGDLPHDVALRDVGEHWLKDFARPIRILQLGDERHPPLKTISNTNLPRLASSLVENSTKICSSWGPSSSIFETSGTSSSSERIRST